MKKLYLSLVRCAFILSNILFFSLESTFGQSLRIYEDIGGNGTSSESSGDSDNTFVYVAAAVIIGGLIAYALLRNKKEKKEETDTTSVGSLLNESILSQQSNFNQPEQIKENIEIPVDLFFGIKNEDAMIPEKTYVVGLSVKF